MPSRLKLRLCLIALVLIAALPLCAQNAASPGPLHFRFTLSKDVVPEATSGRLFVLMTDSPQLRDAFRTGFVPGSTWIAAMEIEYFAPGGTVEFDPDRQAYPKPFSQAKLGTYQLMALLDRNHTYAYHGQDEGDLTSAVVKVENINPASSAPIELTLSRVTPARVTPLDTESVKLVEFQSPLLTAFHGRAIIMRAGIVLPPGYNADAKKFYPTVYHIHGFGGDHTVAWREGQELAIEMGEGKSAAMLHVFLDASGPGGHHEFADSVNNGPWGRPDGTPRNLVRQNGRDVAMFEEFARQEEVLGEYGGQLASFEWVWSPRGEDGRSMKAFNRETGELNQEVLKYWQHYDIRLILDQSWPKLGPKLKGKINVICGDADTFHLNEAVVLLCDFFKQKRSDAVCELVPGRDHGNLYQPEPQHYPEGLAARINKEMQAKYEQAAKANGLAH